MTRLFVNVDHVATIREARKTLEPDPLKVALLVEKIGVDGITVHLREDRRHIQDEDVRIIRKNIGSKLNLEILNNLEKFTELEKPILLGISRKTFIGNILNLPPERRLEGSLAASVIGVYKGVSILRTHDVKATRNAIKVTEAIIQGENM